MVLKKGLDILRDLGRDDATDPLVIKQEVCRAAEKNILASAIGKQLPGDYLLVELVTSETMRQVYEGQLIKGRMLEKDVRLHLRQEGCALTEKLQVEVKFVRRLPDGENFRLKWYRREVTARLTVLRGQAEKKFYNLDRDIQQVFIGRAHEVVDKHGFLIRHNSIVFENLDDEINGSISRQHGWLQFDEATQSFRLFDQESKQGTRIERAGKVKKIAPAGEVLQDGDMIYVGKSQMRFSLKVHLNEC